MIHENDNLEQIYLDKIWEVFIKANPNAEPMLSGVDEEEIKKLLKEYRDPESIKYKWEQLTTGSTDIFEGVRTYRMKVEGGSFYRTDIFLDGDQRCASTSKVFVPETESDTVHIQMT